MPDLIEDLRRYADATTATVPELDLRRVRPHGSRGRRLVVAAAVVALAVVGTTFALFDGSDGPRVVTTDPTTPTSEATATTAETTATTIAEQSSLRTFPVTAISDEEILVWAGEAGSEEAIRGDGFAINVASGAVREIPPAPIAARSGATGVWTGTELVVCCGTGRADGYGTNTQSAAAWNPATGEWRTLARPPEAVARSYPTAVWTGTQMLVVATGPAAALYDPTTDAWTAITPPPIRGRQPQAAWTGSEVFVWDPVYGTGAFPPSGDVEDRGWRWAPGDDGWTELPPLPAGSRTRLGSMAWTGTDLVVWGLSVEDDALGVGAWWRPGDSTWSPIAPSPQGPVPDPFDGTPGSQTVVAGDGGVVVKDLDGGQTAAGANAAGPLMLYEPTTDHWQTTSLSVVGYSPVIVVAGDRVFVPDRVQPLVGTLPRG
jgi:hypothetical protein